MHARNRTWTLGSDPAERCRQRTLPVEGGDGSTLSLDFTTGVLDPRLTFQRLGNATFINSSGQVKYAEQNLFFNTNFAGISGSNPTLSNVGWSYGFTAGTTTFNGDGSVTMSASGGRCTINRITGFAGSGRRIIVSIDITSNGDTGLIPTQLLRDSTLTNSVYYIDSNLYTSGTVVGPCTLTFVADSPTAGNITPFFGVGTSGNVTATVTFARPRFGLWDGTFPLPYVVNTSSGASPSEYHGPRFDYDPTAIGTPRGLLMEATANNELQRSNAFNTSPWYTSNLNTPSIASPPVTDPGGGTDTWYCVPSGAGAVHHGFRYNTTFTAVAHTFSIWAKAAQHDKFVISDLSGGQGACRFDLTAKTANVIAGIVTPTNPQIIEYPNGWFRCSFTMVMAAATRGMTYSSYPTSATVNAFGASFTATGTDGMYFYGAQTEIGSGASSYIPTGASTGTRNADTATMSSVDSLGFDLFQGTVLVRGLQSKEATAGFPRAVRFVGGATEPLGLAVNGSVFFGTSRNASGTTIAEATRTNTLNTNFAFAFALNANEVTNTMVVSRNGSGTSGVRTALGPTAALTSLSFNTNSSETAYACMSIKSLKFWPVAKTLAELNALTSGA